ncbi:UNVERIFIED_CONTAM: hypothetical protein GTU68_054425 [Idotea baltica]|nr:hypothetical protein [Idotea baltica]
MDADEVSRLRPSRLEISRSALRNNYDELSKLVAPAKLMPVLKANAYGHGMIECAKIFTEMGATCFCVAYVEEAIALRNGGVQGNILVMGGLSGEQIDLFIEHDLDITASSVGKLQRIEVASKRLGKKARVQLKIDTGMHRIGVNYKRADSMIEEAASCKNCNFVGAFSHFAKAEDPDLSYSKLQLQRFKDTLEVLEARLGDKLDENFVRHISNSGSTLQFKEAHLDFVRPGLALYGASPNPHQEAPVALSPAMTIRSEVCFFKVVNAGSGVSYGHTWTATKDTQIVTIPIGYGDGFPRRLGNKASALIRGKRYPIVGRVCMDQCMIDIGDDKAFNNDEVVLLGKQGDEEISLTEIAELLETDPREFLCQLNIRLPRLYVD